MHTTYCRILNRRTAMPIQLMTVADVCNSLKLSPRTLRRIVKEGRLKPIRVRGAIRFRQPDVERLVDETADETTARLPTLQELPELSRTATECCKEWNEAISQLLRIVSIWVVTPPCDPNWMEYLEDQINKLDGTMRAYVEPWINPPRELILPDK
jgi:excisionase family DNA binding protein